MQIKDELFPRRCNWVSCAKMKTKAKTKIKACYRTRLERTKLSYSYLFSTWHMNMIAYLLSNTFAISVCASTSKKSAQFSIQLKVFEKYLLMFGSATW